MMRRPNSGDQKQNREQLLLSLLVCIVVSMFYAPSDLVAEKWTGVDEAVVENIAKDHGREKQEPLINTDQGDLPLFCVSHRGYNRRIHGRLLLENTNG